MPLVTLVLMREALRDLVDDLNSSVSFFNSFCTSLADMNQRILGEYETMSFDGYVLQTVLMAGRKGWACWAGSLKSALDAGPAIQKRFLMLGMQALLFCSHAVARRCKYHQRLVRAIYVAQYARTCGANDMQLSELTCLSMQPGCLQSLHLAQAFQTWTLLSNAPRPLQVCGQASASHQIIKKRLNPN